MTRHSEAGNAGGYQLVAGYRTRLTGMTAAEAEALALAGIPGPAGDEPRADSDILMWLARRG